MKKLRIFNKNISYKCRACDGGGIIKDEHNNVVEEHGQIKRCTCFYINNYLDANIGYDYWNVNRDNFQGDISDFNKIAKFTERIQELKEKGLGLFLYGSNGSGKSTLGCYFLRQVINFSPYTAMFVPFSDLVILNSRIVGSYYDKEAAAEIEQIKNVDFIVLDDIGKEFDSNKDYGRFTLNSILRYRDLWHKPTIFTSNTAMSELQTIYGLSNFSLIEGRTIYIKLKNEQDYRRERKIDVLVDMEIK